MDFKTGKIVFHLVHGGSLYFLIIKYGWTSPVGGSNMPTCKYA